MAEPSHAARSLKAIVARPKFTQSSIAELCDVTPQAVAHWISGTTKPLDRYRKLIEAATGIPVSAWDEPTEEAASKVA